MKFYQLLANALFFLLFSFSCNDQNLDTQTDLLPLDSTNLLPLDSTKQAGSLEFIKEINNTVDNNLSGGLHNGFHMSQNNEFISITGQGGFNVFRSDNFEFYNTIIEDNGHIKYKYTSPDNIEFNIPYQILDTNGAAGLGYIHLNFLSFNQNQYFLFERELYYESDGYDSDNVIFINNNTDSLFSKILPNRAISWKTHNPFIVNKNGHFYFHKFNGYIKNNYSLVKYDDSFIQLDSIGEFKSNNNHLYITELQEVILIDPEGNVLIYNEDLELQKNWAFEIINEDWDVNYSNQFLYIFQNHLQKYTLDGTLIKEYTNPMDESTTCFLIVNDYIIQGFKNKNPIVSQLKD